MFWTVIFTLVLTYFLVDWLLRLLKVGNYGNKYVFVTGCDSGFGRELAIRLDKMGFHVFAGCLTKDGGESLGKECSNRLEIIVLDVTKTESIEAAHSLVRQKLPTDTSLWGVVNNAGVTGMLGVSEMCTKTDYLEACDVNTFGPIEVSRIFMPLLRKSRGRLVIITSVMGRCAAVFAPYCVSKFGLEAFCDCIRKEIAPFGVKVSIIEPGFFATTLFNTDRFINSISKGFERSSEDVQKAYGGNKYVEKNKAISEFQETLISKDIYKVIDAYVNALTSRFPRARYVVGTDAKLIFVPLSFLPEWIGDGLQRFRVSQILKDKGLVD